MRSTHHENGIVNWSVPLLNGESHGPSTVWHENGQVSVHGYYQFGKRHGLFLYFSESEELIEKKLFEEGVVVWTGKPADILPRRADGLVVDIHKNRPEARQPPQVTIAPDRDLDYATTMIGVHQGEGRTALSANLSATKSFGRGFALASVERSQLLENADTVSGAKTSVFVGGGFRVFQTGNYSGTVLTRLGRGIAGDNFGGLVASSLTSYNRLSGIGSKEPNSTIAKLMASGHHRTSQRTFRFDLGLTPVFSHNNDNPRSVEDNQLWGHLEVSATIPFDSIIFSASVAATKRIGSSQEGTMLSSGGFAMEFGRTMWRPRIEAYTPLDDKAGEVFVLGLGFGIGLQDYDSE